MRIIEKDGLRILISEENKMLKDINDNGVHEILEDGTKINEEPYLTKEVYLASNLADEEAFNLYEEVDYEENN